MMVQVSWVEISENGFVIVVNMVLIWCKKANLMFGQDANLNSHGFWWLFWLYACPVLSFLVHANDHMFVYGADDVNLVQRSGYQVSCPVNSWSC